MAASLRLIVYFLVMTLAIHAVGWTFNQEAIADVWFNEQACQSEQAADAAALHQELNKNPAESPCNHWCYTVGQFIGLLSPIGFITPEFATVYASRQSSTIQFSAPDGRFRPPQHHS